MSRYRLEQRGSLALHAVGAILIAISTLALPIGRLNAQEQPTITLSPRVVSCTTSVTVRGSGFIPGSEVIVSEGGVEDIPRTSFEAFWGPVTVDNDGTFTIEVQPRPSECIGLPPEDHQLTASTRNHRQDVDIFGPPAVTASYTYEPDPTDPKLTLSPDHGSGCIEVTARGENFTPGTYVNLYAGALGGHNFAQTVQDYPLVGNDGSFSITLPQQLTPFITCGNQPLPPDGTQYIVSAQTGRPKIDDSQGGPTAGHVFTVTLPPADRFEQVWARTDAPVADGAVDRTWIWGPEPFTEVREELYINSPGDMRQVQYYDKSRMEINDPDGDRTSPWYVTNGLLVVEMVEGRVQTGDNWYEESYDPAEIQIAGDPGSASPTYAEINALGLLGKPAREEGTIIDEYFYHGHDRVWSLDAYGDWGITAAHYVPETDHTIASVFWDFMNGEGLVAYPGQQQYYAVDLFPNPFYATGYPITEAYWTTTEVSGELLDVLWQCFERRCLTYTPGNPDGWKVEAGNVGRHYYEWRYNGQ